MKKIILLILFYSFGLQAAMDKDRCGGAVITALKTINTSIGGATEAALLPYWVAICDQIILEIKNNMDVTTSVSVPGVTAGSFTATGTGNQTSIE